MAHALCLARCSSGATILRSSLLERCGFRHGFSTRRGGVSEAPFEQLNLARPDSAAEMAAFAVNRARFLSACDLASRVLVTVRQVHGCAVADGDEIDLDAMDVEADAIVSRDPHRAIGVRTADCVPVLVACQDTGAVAAIHAGWRGIVAGVIERAIDAMRRRPTGRLVAAIGPAISCAAYEVGGEVAGAFASRDLGDCVHRGPSGREHVDCHAAVARILVRHGVDASSIDGTPWCTFGDADLCYSHRRDAARSGRMLAVIGAEALRRP
ncbi:MAG: peptidoglycan editing factor PgeF [Phycisphaerales bacterium]